jgi:hypothetical protein
MNKISCPHTYPPPLPLSPTLDNRMFSPERRHGQPRVIFLCALRGYGCLRTKGLTPAAESASSCQLAAPASSIAVPGCLSRIPDLNFFHPASRIKKIPDPGPASKNI